MDESGDANAEDVTFKGKPSRLCDLPDEILHLVMWFLSTKDSFMISMVVSKRLESLWRSLPIVRLDQQQFPNRMTKDDEFIEFAHRAILHRSSPIHVFELSSVASCVQMLIDAAFALGVQQEFILYVVYKHHELMLPACIFQSQTLSKLHLNLSGVPLSLPRRVHLPSLKDLILQNLTFICDDSTRELLSLPSLERLHVENCHSKQLKALNIFAPMLHTLKLHFLSECPDLVICAPGLKVFHYDGVLTARYVISGSPSLDDAEISIYGSYGRKDHIYIGFTARLHKLLQAISSVKSLIFSITEPEEQFSGFPAFPNLTHLYLNYISNYLDWKALSLLLASHFPSLVTLEFQSAPSMNVENCHKFQKDPLIPLFHLSNLMKLTINSFRYEDMLFLEDMLWLAPMLKEAVLACKDSMLENIQHCKAHYSSKLPMTSESCRILVTSRTYTKSLQTQLQIADYAEFQYLCKLLMDI